MPATAVQTRTTWAIDPTHANVEFAIKHLMISTVKGRFSDVKGTVELDGDDLSSARVAATIDVASIDTRQDQRDGHLRSADFFDVERFPAMTFTSTRVTQEGDRIRIEGDLTIRGVTKNVTLSGTEEGRGRDPWGGERLGFSATTKFNRRDFGLTWNQALEAGGFVVGDEVKVTIDVELVRQR